MEVDFTLEEIRVLIATELQKSQKSKRVMPELLSRSEAAMVLGIKENTLALWACRGKGPAPTKIGSRILYRLPILLEYIEENTLPRDKRGQ